MFEKNETISTIVKSTVGRTICYGLKNQLFIRMIILFSCAI